MSRIRLLIVDDYSIVRRGLRSFIQFLPDVELVGEASSGREALAQLHLQPDVILMDFMMPEMDGLTALRAIKQLNPGIAILILTTFCTYEMVAEALNAHASGFLLKSVGVDELAKAIQAAYRGEIYLQSTAIQMLVCQSSSASASFGASPLTPREQQVYGLVTRGYSNKQIAGELQMSEKTVSVHISRLMGKLGLNNRTQIAVHALGHRL